MFQFAFDRGLLTFKLNMPAFAWLFQLPPRIGIFSPAYVGSRLKRQIPQKISLCSLLLDPAAEQLACLGR